MNQLKKVRKEKRVDKCSVCGMCKSNCPVFGVLKTEVDSPRGKALLLKEDVHDSIFYKCTLCGSCKINCPSKIEVDEDIREQRSELAKEGKVPKQIEVMIKNVREYGNPYGKVEKGKIPKELYCC
jgi:fumarate reductase (CoM/CoB) subunit B